MAQYTKSQLVSASNATYFTNTSGGISASAVRDLNDSWISSSALLSGSNTFIGNQIISGTLTAQLPANYIWLGDSNGYNQAVATSSISLQGAQGIQGIQGTQGIQGITGLQGLQGLQGIQGLQGTQGIQGITGLQGIQGIEGASGSQGIQGLQGLQGIQGADNSTQGTQGIQGLQGLQGIQGITGISGSNGAQGIQGIQGIQGADNSTQGTQGIQGITGLQGITGISGSNGAQGTQGIQGVQGTDNSTQGAQGAQGIAGSAGSGSADTGSLLVTASFASTNITFTKGDATTFNLPGFATTGSNTFIGNQKLDGKLTISGSDSNQIFFERQGGGDILRLGVSQNGNTFELGLTGSVNKTMWLIDNQGGTRINTFDAPIIATNYLIVQGALTASLQQGYAWVGNSSNVSTLVATSSFGTSIDTGSFATTGSNTFYGSQTISGSVLPLSNFGGSLGSSGQNWTNLYVNEIQGLSNLRVDTIKFNGVTLPLASSQPRQLFGNGIDADTAMYYATSSANVNALRELAYVQSGSATTPDMNILSASFASTIASIVTGTGFATTGSNTFTGDQNILGSLTASLANGYVWVGNSSNVSTLVATSSFGSGGTIDTGSFLTTGSLAFGGSTNKGNGIYQFNIATGSAGYAIEIFNTGSDALYGGTGSMRFGITDPGNPFIQLKGQPWFQFGTGNQLQFQSFTSSYDNGIIIGPYYTASEKVHLMPRSSSLQFSQDIGSGEVPIFTLGTHNGVSQSIFEKDLRVKGQFTASLQQGYAWVGNSGGVSSLVATSSFGGGTTYINPTLNPYSGSLILVANTFTSSSFAHISASANGQVNLVFKNNNNTATTTISGSNNIFTNPTAPGAGFKRYIGGSGNLMLNPASVTQISASQTFPITTNFNIHTAGAISTRAAVSASAWAINQNLFIGSIQVGNATANAEKLLGTLTIANNQVGNTLVIQANKTAISQSTTINSNALIGGSTSLIMASSSIGYTSNVGSANITNGFQNAGATTGNNQLSLQQNWFGAAIINVSGSDAGGLTNPRCMFNNYLFSGYQTLLTETIANLSLNGSGSSMVSTMAMGHELGITGSNGVDTNIGGLTPGIGAGSAFFGRWNAQDGNRARTAETVFAVGTGTSTSLTKTGFLIDSGSNSYFEGTLNVSGSTAMTGSLVVSSFTTLASVSSSLNFADDTAAGAGGVPLGGLYRNGNFVMIRLT